MHERYTKLTRSLIEAGLTSPGTTSSALRCASEAHAAQLSGRTSSQASQLPPEVERYLSKVALHAYKVADEDIVALRTAGYDEDAIFELTLSAALGAGMARLERGMAALKGETHAAQED
jgi:hypothetical protein